MGMSLSEAVPDRIFVFCRCTATASRGDPLGGRFPFGTRCFFSTDGDCLYGPR